MGTEANLSECNVCGKAIQLVVGPKGSRWDHVDGTYRHIAAPAPESDLSSVPGILHAAAMGGHPITTLQACQLQEAIASCAIEGVPVPDAAGIARLAKEITNG